MKYLLDTDHISFLQRRSAPEHAPVLPFDAAAATALDGLRVRHVRIAAMDLRIAAISLSRNLVLLTRNERDFGRVPGLLTEDWTV